MNSNPILDENGSLTFDENRVIVTVEIPLSTKEKQFLEDVFLYFQTKPEWQSWLDKNLPLIAKGNV